MEQLGVILRTKTPTCHNLIKEANEVRQDIFFSIATWEVLLRIAFV